MPNDLEIQSAEKNVAMELCDVLQRGFLTKSPPLKTKGGLSKFFKARWRRRYFYLYKLNSLQSKFQLEYFTDSTATKAKGSVDLDKCHHVVTCVKMGKWNNVFSLKTMHKGHERVYYLVADTEAEMHNWVHVLCTVCGFSSGGESDIVRPTDMVPSTPISSQERRRFSFGTGSLQRSNTRTSQTGAFNSLSSSTLITSPLATGSTSYLGIAHTYRNAGRNPSGRTIGSTDYLTPTGRLHTSQSISSPGYPVSASGPEYYNLATTNNDQDIDDGYKKSRNLPSECDHSYVNVSANGDVIASSLPSSLPPINDEASYYIHMRENSGGKKPTFVPYQNRSSQEQERTITIDGNEYVLPSEFESLSLETQSRSASLSATPVSKSDNKAPADEYFNIWDTEVKVESSTSDVIPPPLPKKPQSSIPSNQTTSKASSNPVNNLPFELNNAKVYRRSQIPPETQQQYFNIFPDSSQVIPDSDYCLPTDLQLAVPPNGVRSHPPTWISPASGLQGPPTRTPDSSPGFYAKQQQQQSFPNNGDSVMRMPLPCRAARERLSSSSSSSSSSSTSENSHVDSNRSRSGSAGLDVRIQDREIPTPSTNPPPLPPPPANRRTPQTHSVPPQGASSLALPTLPSRAHTPPTNPSYRTPATTGHPTSASPRPPASNSSDLNYIDSDRLDLGPSQPMVHHQQSKVHPEPTGRPISVTEYKDIDMMSTHALAQVAKLL